MGWLQNKKSISLPTTASHKSLEIQTKMATALEDFSSWLSRTLQELNTDESVFGSYILSIVDSDESPDEQNEALQGILSEIIENVSIVFTLSPVITCLPF